MTRDCKYKKRIAGMLDGELSPQMEETLVRHLKECDVCKKEYKVMALADSLMKNMPEIEPSSDFDKKFWKTVAHLEDQKGRFPFRDVFSFRWASYTGAALASILIAWFAFFYSRPFTPNNEDILIAENLELLKDFEVIRHMDLLENWEAVEAVGGKS